MAQQPNPFRPTEAEVPLVKLFAWGSTGVGKSRLGLTFPGPIAVIDTEASTALYAGRSWASPFDRLTTKTYEDIRRAVTYLAGGNHPYKTVMVDPVTVVWDVLQESQSIRRMARSGEDADFTRLDWGKVKRLYKALLSDLVNLPMHVVVTARESVLYEGEGNNLRAVGFKADAEKSTDYGFDTVVRLMKDARGNRSVLFVKDRSIDGEASGRDGATLPGIPPFSELFAMTLAAEGTGSVARAVPSDTDAARAGADGPTPRQVAALVAALDAAGIDPEAVKAHEQVEDFRDLAPARVKTLTDQALRRVEKAAQAATQAHSAPEASEAPVDPTPIDSAAPVAVEAA